MPFDTLEAKKIIMEEAGIKAKPVEEKKEEDAKE